jgi:tetratricopeptide (TPR) repeat protein
MVDHQPAAGTEESRAAGPPAHPAASDRIVVGEIPEPRQGFMPRPALLAQLKDAGRGSPTIYVLTGPCGTGKTQLAAAYARARLAAGWRLVAWVNAEKADSVLAGLAAVAAAIRRSGSRPEPGATDAGQDVRDWLEADGAHCLLVFDDAEDPDALSAVLPAGGAALVLITSDREPVADLGTSIPVGVFSAEEAMALLEGRIGAADQSGAAAVAAELGYLPMALDQAAAAIAGQRLACEEYLRRLRAIQAGEYLPPDEGRSYPPGAVEAVLLALEAAQAEDQAGVGGAVLEIMAVLSAAGVRREVLHAAGETGALAGGRRPVATGRVDQALVQLAEHALVTFTVDRQSVIMHRMVARVVREGLARRGHLAAVCRAAASALEVYAEALAGPQDRAAVIEIPKQVTALLDNAAGPADGSDEGLAGILLRPRFLALYHLVELGDSMPQAIAVGEPLTADLERVLGPEHPGTLTAMNSLAAAYQAVGRTAEAIPLFEQALVGQVRRLGHDHPDTLASQNNLAATYQDAGRAAEAILLFRLALAAKERQLGVDHPSTLNSRGNLAAAYRDVGRIAEAIPLFEQTLAGRERLLGPDHPDTLRSRNNLAVAYRKAGRAADAIPLLEQTLAGQERLLGPDHPDTLRSRNNLAAVYRKAGRAAEAIPLLEQTLAACERLLGTHDPRTQVARDNLAHARQEAVQPRSQLVRDEDADGDDDADGDGDAVREGEGEGEGDLDGFGDGEPDGLGERDADGDSGMKAGDDWTGGGVAVRRLLTFGDGFVAAEEETAGAVAVAAAVALLDVRPASGRTGRARAGCEPAKVSTETVTAATVHTTTAAVATAGPGLTRGRAHRGSLIALARRVSHTRGGRRVIGGRSSSASGAPDEHSGRTCSRSSGGSGASGSRAENAGRSASCRRSAQVSQFSMWPPTSSRVSLVRCPSRSASNSSSAGQASRPVRATSSAPTALSSRPRAREARACASLHDTPSAVARSAS